MPPVSNSANRNRHYELPLQRLFQALVLGGDAELRQQAGIYDTLRRRLPDRNNALLAHGVKPATADGYNAVRKAAPAAGEVADADIPR